MAVMVEVGHQLQLQLPLPLDLAPPLKPKRLCWRRKKGAVRSDPSVSVVMKKDDLALAPNPPPPLKPNRSVFSWRRKKSAVRTDPSAAKPPVVDEDEEEEEEDRYPRTKKMRRVAVRSVSDDPWPNPSSRALLEEKEKEGMELGICSSVGSNNPCYSGGSGSNNTPTPTYVSMASPSGSQSGSREPSSPSPTDAYRSIMSAFHASGPLDWEKEAMLSDLRLMLHIPDNEHRLHLKHLLAASQTETETEEEECCLAPKSQQALHILEFDAYCSTFHASGPLTLERKVMLSNLRLLLHISDAEHRLATTAKATT